MILPAAEDILGSVEAALEKIIGPALSGTVEQSAAASAGHLLRHVRLRLAQEGQILVDDIAASRRLLMDMAVYFGSVDESAMVAGIQAALAQPGVPEGIYPTLAELGGIAGKLRAAVEAGLARLQALRSAHGAAPDYVRLREAVRTWIGMQLQAEAQLIEPAFAGRGPRR